MSSLVTTACTFLLSFFEVTDSQLIVSVCERWHIILRAVCVTKLPSSAYVYDLARLCSSVENKSVV